MPQTQISFSEKDVYFYDDNGYMVVENMLSPDMCEEAVSIYKKYALPDYRGIMNLERGIIEYRDYAVTKGGVSITAVMKVEDKDAEFIWDIIRHPSIVAALEALQEATVINLQSMFLFKEANTPYAAQAWNPHQDGAYPRAQYGMYITGNLCFTDQDKENGCMYIYPGSHREPILLNEPVQSFHEKLGSQPGHRVKVPEKYLAKKTDLIMAQGSVLFLHANVIHGSYPNVSPTRSRYMLLVPYGTKGIASNPGFISGRTGRREEHSLRKTWRELFYENSNIYIFPSPFTAEMK